MTTAPAAPPAIAAWHRLVEVGREDRAAAYGLLDEVLTDDVVFRSPAVHTPQEGRAITTAYLRAALVVLGPTLTYQRAWYAADSAVLEFTATVGEKHVHGIDMIAWDAQDRIVDFTVMVRPQQGLAALIEQMGAELLRTAEEGGR